MPITDSSSEYINPILAGLTAASYNGNLIKLQVPGGEVHILDGQWRQIPNGERLLQFQPKAGTRNLTPGDPPSPLVTPPNSTPVPAQRGLRLNPIGSSVASGALAIAIAQGAMLLYKEWKEYGDQVELKRAQDLDMIGFILLDNTAELQPLAEPAQNPNRKRKRWGGRERRIRIHGYSRRKA